MPPLDLPPLSPTFHEDFASGSLHRSRWLTRYWWGGRSLPGNGELQYFADDACEVVQAHPQTSPLRIRAHPDRPGARVLAITARPSPDPGLTGGLPFLSGMINTHGSFAQRHGYFEMGARLPAGAGLWPAFWLLPADGAWPPEIDVMECLGRDTATYHAGAHWPDGTGGRGHLTRAVAAGVDLSGGFNRFGCLWTASDLVFFLNGAEVCRMIPPEAVDRPMYMLAGLAVGGSWGGAPDATTAFPAEMLIDGVRAWSLPEPGGSGR